MKKLRTGTPRHLTVGGINIRVDRPSIEPLGGDGRSRNHLRADPKGRRSREETRSQQARTSHPLVLDGGWIILTIILWGFSLFGLAIHAVAAWYETRCIHLGNDQLVLESIGGVERVPFADMERLTTAVREPPRALIKAGLLVSLLNWRAAGPTLSAAGRNDPMLYVVARDDWQWTFGLTEIHNVERLIAVLKQAGVTVDLDPESWPDHP